MICIDCGINVKSGRPVLTSQGVDEEEFNDTAKAWIRLLSFFMWLTPVPIPIRSEAFGTRKPYAIWTIAALTVLTSISFFIYQKTNEFVPPGNELMLWPTTAGAHVKPIKWNRVQEIAEDLSDGQRQRLHERYGDPDQKLSDEEVVTRLITDLNASRGHFHFYQLITHAFLHDTTSIFGFIMHLGGNMLFLLVFGPRVNALIGDLATAILYPILAVAAAGAQLLAGGDVPLLGASGAIMGLAGMYLILFPAHRVFCAMWIAMWFWFRRLFCFCKIFRVRGFLILLFYFGYDIVANLLTSKSQGGVAHLAHIGGFSTGMILGFAILFSRLWNTRGGDVLSVTLGKHAWPLIGKPSRWIESQSPLPRAVSLTYR